MRPIIAVLFAASLLAEEVKTGVSGPEGAKGPQGPVFTQREILLEIKNSDLEMQLADAKFQFARRAMEDATREYKALESAAAAKRVEACKSVSGAKADDCDYDFAAWKITLKPKKEPAQ